MHKQVLIITTTIAVTLAGAWLQPGHLYRVANTKALQSAADRVKSLPNRIGNWEYVEDSITLAPSIVKELGLSGYTSRKYRNIETNESVAVLLMAGSPGRLLRHPPDICYANRGKRSLTPGELDIESAGDTHHYRVLHYVENDPSKPDSSFSVAYAHTASKHWDVPAYPRMEYGGVPALYKVQVLYGSENGNSAAEDVLSDFIKSFVTTF